MSDLDENIFADPRRLEGHARAHRFDMLLRSPRTAVMLASLPPGETAARREATDARADRVVYLIEGEARGSVGGREQSLDAGLGHETENRAAGKRKLGHSGDVKRRRASEHSRVENRALFLIRHIEDARRFGSKFFLPFLVELQGRSL